MRLFLTRCNVGNKGAVRVIRPDLCSVRTDTCRGPLALQARHTALRPQPRRHRSLSVFFDAPCTVHCTNVTVDLSLLKVVDLWTPLELTRRIARELDRIDELDALLEWSTRTAYTVEDKEEGGLVHKYVRSRSRHAEKQKLTRWTQKAGVSARTGSPQASTARRRCSRRRFLVSTCSSQDT